MPNLAADLRAMMAASEFGTGDPKVCTVEGQEVACLPSRATTADQISIGDTITAGQTLVLRIAREDAPDLNAGSSITWNGKTWTVTHAPTLADGALVRAFLGRAR